MKMKKSDLDEKEFREKLGIKEITYGEFLGQVQNLLDYLEKKKNYEGISVLQNLLTPEMREDLVVRWVAGQALKDGLAITKDGKLAIRDIT